MTPFDRRWLHLAAAARRAPGTPQPMDVNRLLPQAISRREDWILPKRLGWIAAAWLFACALSLSWMPDVLSAARDLAPTAPALPALRRPPRLPPPPVLPDVPTLVQSLTSKESVR